LISDDDFLLPGFYERAICALQNNPDAAFFSGGMLTAESNGRVRGLVRYGSDSDHTYAPSQLFRLLAPYCRTWTSALFRRSSLEAMGGLKTQTGYSFSIDMILRLSTRFSAVLSDTPCAVLTFHSGSSSVAEASQAFESLLNLAFFDSINHAIESACRDDIVTEHEAQEMRSVLHRSAERNFFHGAFGLVARGDLPIAFRTSKVLAQVFKRRDMAAAIDAVASDNMMGSFLRAGLRRARAMRALWFARNGTVRLSEYSDLVRARMLQLDA
jgi:hypothetical protein